MAHNIGYRLQLKINSKNVKQEKFCYFLLSPAPIVLKTGTSFYKNFKSQTKNEVLNVVKRLVIF